VQRRAFIARSGLSLAAVLAGCSPNQALAPREPAPDPAPAADGAPFLFSTGVENSSPTVRGRRVDELAKTGHYDRWQEDFARLRELGIGTLRYGPAPYRTHPAPGRFDWSTADEPMAWLERAGVTVVADLCHFGVPDWLGGFDDPRFPDQLAEYAGAFARRYPWVRHFTPINEPYIAALFSAYFGWWNESRTGETAFGRTIRSITIAHEQSVQAVRAERPDAIIVQTESAERYTAADGSPGAAAAAARWSAYRFAALDLTLGHAPEPATLALLDRAGTSGAQYDLLLGDRARGERWLGVDYYASCEQSIRADGTRSPAPRRVGLAAVARAYHERYGLPLYLTETSRAGDGALAWLEEQWGDALLLRASGVPVRGFTWYALTDTVDWQHLLREDRGDVDPAGLCTLDRTVRPVGQAYQRLIEKWQAVLARAVALRAG
jgi:beta-glucosidase/6-phospho-beta-glucosidase/beta-galactosidase